MNIYICPCFLSTLICYSDGLWPATLAESSTNEDLEDIVEDVLSVTEGAVITYSTLFSIHSCYVNVTEHKWSASSFWVQ